MLGEQFAVSGFAQVPDQRRQNLDHLVMVGRVAGALGTIASPFLYRGVQSILELVPVLLFQQVGQSIVQNVGGRPVAGV